MGSRSWESVRPYLTGAEDVDVANDGYVAPVIELGQWVPCSGYLHMIHGTNCHDLPIRDCRGLNGVTHDHYVVCGCRWTFGRRTKMCKKHPRRGWES